MKKCRHCGFDILRDQQPCIAKVNQAAPWWCDAELLWIGFRFSPNLADERHKFALELRAAHLTAEEVGDVVVAQTEDIVMVDEIFKRTVDHSRGTVRANCRRFTDSELALWEDEVRDGERNAGEPRGPHDSTSAGADEVGRDSNGGS